MAHNSQVQEGVAEPVPAGVAIGFLQLLQREQADGIRRTVLWLTMIFVVVALSLLVDPVLGPAIQLALIGLAFGLGWWIFTLRNQSYQQSLQAHWKPWMELAPIAPSTAALFANVAGRPYRVALRVSLFVGCFVIFELVALVFAFHESPVVWKAIPLLVLHGLIGAFLAHAARSYQWHKELRRSLEEMVQSGELGVWGVK